MANEHGVDKGAKLNWRQACQLLGCSRSHLYRLVNSGSLPAWRPGGKRGMWVWEADCLALVLPLERETAVTAALAAPPQHSSR